MNQAELILKVASISGESKKAVESILKTAGDVIQAELQEGGKPFCPASASSPPSRKPRVLGATPRPARKSTSPPRLSRISALPRR